MRLLTLAIGTTLLSVPLPASIHAQTPGIAGTWTPTPLVEFNKPDPETGGIFRKLGDAWILSDGSMVFWARYGEKDKPGWALYSVKDGPPKLVLRADEEFTAPDGVKKRYRLFDLGSTLGTNELYVGRHAVYFALRPGLYQESVYGILGGSLVRLIGRGDTLRLGGPAAALKRVTVEGLTHDGLAVLHYWTEKPAEREGWLLHDGRQASHLWNQGDPVPGESEPVTIEGLVSGPHRFGDTTLVVFDTKRNRGQSVLYRIISASTERLLVSETPSPVEPGKKLRWPEVIRPASGSRFLLGVGAEEFVINRSQGFFAWQNEYKPRMFPTQWLEYRDGTWHQVMGLDRAAADQLGFGPLADSIGYLRPGGDTVLIATSFIQVGPRPPYGGGPQVTRRVPGFWVYDGSNLKPVPLSGTGVDIVTLSAGAKKSNRLLNPFGLHPVPGTPGSAVAEIPGLLGGVKVFQAGGPALREPARFTLAGATWPVSEADVVGWLDQRSVVVGRQLLGIVMGYYRLVRE